MHYFKRNIGDYHKKAGRLTMVEHGAYTLLLDACYDREAFPTFDEAMDWCWARSDEERAAVEFVLGKFFDFDGDRYIQTRIQEEIEQYRLNASKNAVIAKNREEKRRASKAPSVKQSQPNEHEACSSVHEAPPNHKPLTINQEPVTKNQEPNNPKVKSRGATAARLPADWKPDDVDIAYLKAKRPDLNVSDVEENFRDYWIAQAGARGRKTDWHATWRTWVRNEKRLTHLETNNGQQREKTRHEKLNEHIATITGRNKQQRIFDDPGAIDGTAERLD